ncbi:Abhydrolase-3 domain-containing protein [Favolaschia claudopus]|uniref:Abhydrolase-3 domain-containing protein n=1 Tax=Favolaschia claudopus TaxID=2862362 RepID=A0AAW0E286_9AGAR
MNSLTTEAGFKIGPILLETLVKHYFERLKHNLKLQTELQPGTSQLRKEELLYDEAFNIIKAFLNAASYHTVEEVQAFSNTRTPSPPWVHVVRLLVPMSVCDDAAQYVIKALGGEDMARKMVGGCKWWQVRGVPGVDAQWITAKKDWQEAKRRYKMQNKTKPSVEAPPVDPLAEPAHYEEHMDEMRCILYSHGGGYYFGSVDQERYSIQRHARKINGRVFAINYRLAPQYPFPCALQDLVAAYLYLIRPPPDASHRPVNPAHLVVAGDSAGGGLTLALLQVLRDTGLPLPAGGVLISPWCDLTHSFPSIHLNTATDVIPEYGLSFQKPSSLWPPPPDDMSRKVHASLRTWIRHTFKDDPRPSTPPPGPASAVASTTSLAVPEPPISASRRQSVESLDMGATTPLPRDSEIITFTANSGEELRIDRQVHMYTQNSSLTHPLISGALSYLGGLPPLLIIASDKEVLRDEIIYTAHKAANPDRFPVTDDVRAMYPPLDGIEKKFGPTKVHLQVYDDTAHVLPVLFSFTTPGKFCYRAIATFSRHVTGMKQTPLRKGSSISRPERYDDLSQLPPLPPTPAAPTFEGSQGDGSVPNGDTTQAPKYKGVRRAASAISRRRLSIFRSSTVPSIKPVLSDSPEPIPKLPSDASGENGSYFDPSRLSTPPASTMSSSKDSTASDVAGPRFIVPQPETPQPVGERAAGEPAVYSSPDWTQGIMVRERVSTRGVLRPLEAEEDLSAFTVLPQNIGVVSELTARRFQDGTQRWDRKFASATKSVEKHRRRNLERAKKDTLHNMNVLHNFIGREVEAKKGKGKEKSDETANGIKDGLLASSGSWSWAWALDGNENPPPSSIVSRRDTAEALRLARIADQPMLQSEEHSMSGNNLWSVITNFLTVTPDKDKYKDEDDGAVEGEKTILRRKSTLARMLSRRRDKSRIRREGEKETAP